MWAVNAVGVVGAVWVAERERCGRWGWFLGGVVGAAWGCGWAVWVVGEVRVEGRAENMFVVGGGR